MFTRAPLLAAVALAVPLALVGCSASGTAGSAAPGAGSDANSSASAAPTASASKAADTNAHFGDTVTYDDDGLAVTVTDKGTFKPSEYAAKEKAKKYVKYQVTIKNGSSDAFSPAIVFPTLQDGEAEASTVTDVEKKIGVPPSTKLLPGRTVKWIVAYGVDTKDLVMQVALNDFKHDDAIYTSK